MKDEPVLRLALSIHAHPGVYALLIGSGVSRAADIPTGWDIVLDLIRKVAAMEGEDPEPDPEAWYKRRFGEPPDYAKLLDKLTTTSAERMALLRAYFEPTEEEKEQGLKVPTAAHRAIATLVELGYVRMILTTNFDRLIERALQEVGIEPEVISTEDDLRGAMPYIHSRCYLVKLHGDYLDTRIKNTPEELENYSPEFKDFLDRVLDEFGLIICGWSGAWDTALRNAILRCPNRRFATYWLVKGELTEEAKKVIHHRRAEVIRIESADQFFTELVEKIEALRELERPHPMSTKAAVATVKRYLSESRHRIRLHDLIHEETERVYWELASERFDTQVPQVTKETSQHRMHEYEAVVERLMAMLAALSYYDTGENAYLLTRCIERLVQPPRRGGGIFSKLQPYPALLLAYASGISALAVEHFHHLAAVLIKPQYRRESDNKEPAIATLNVWDIFHGEEWIPRQNPEHDTPGSNYLFEFLRPVLYDYLPDDSRYEEVFDIFEYLLALTYRDIMGESRTPVGRFGWRYKRWPKDWKLSPIFEFIQTGLKQGPNWGLLKAGFFEGSPERFQEVERTFQEWLFKVTEEMGWR